MASTKDGTRKPVLLGELNRIVDKVLAFEPKPRSKAAKKRAVKVLEIDKMKRAAD